MLAALALSAAPTQACDRTCLTKALDRYLDAVVAHDPTKAGLAKTARETLNGAEHARADGLWKNATALGVVQRRYADPVSGQAAYFGLIEEAGAPGPALVSLRIKVERRKVTEAEWIVARKGEALYSPQGLIAEPPAEVKVAKKDRVPRAHLQAAADSYFEGLQQHKNELVIKKPGCVRLENGTKVTGRRAPAAPPAAADNHAIEFDEADCSNIARMTQIHAVVLRRFPVIDEEKGVVLGTAMFLRPPGGAKRADGTLWPRLLLSEYFTTEQGKITGIYAAMHYLPDAAPQSTGWDK
jgi:hypothetical protein